MSSDKYMPEEMAVFFNKRADGYEAHMKGLDNSDEFYSMVPSPVTSTSQAVKLLDLGVGTGLEIEGILSRTRDWVFANE